MDFLVDGDRRYLPLENGYFIAATPCSRDACCKIFGRPQARAPRCVANNLFIQRGPFHPIHYFTSLGFSRSRDARERFWWGSIPLIAEFDDSIESCIFGWSEVIKNFVWGGYTLASKKWNTVRTNITKLSLCSSRQCASEPSLSCWVISRNPGLVVCKFVAGTHSKKKIRWLVPRGWSFEGYIDNTFSACHSHEQDFDFSHSGK
jgi:hypothetical protein